MIKSNFLEASMIQSKHIGRSYRACFYGALPYAAFAVIFNIFGGLVQEP